MRLSATVSTCGFLEAAFVWSMFLYILLIVVRKRANVQVRGKVNSNTERPITVNTNQWRLPAPPYTHTKFLILRGIKFSTNTSVSKQGLPSGHLPQTSRSSWKEWEPRTFIQGRVFKGVLGLKITDHWPAHLIQKLSWMAGASLSQSTVVSWWGQTRTRISKE